MALTLAQYEARASALLFDTSNAIFSTTIIDGAIRQVLADYTQAVPLAMETVITLPGDGREIALNGISGLEQVTDVWYPYDSDGDEVWPPQRPLGWRLWWDDGSPVLFLTPAGQAQPQTDDEVRIFYTKPHTIQNLDSAAATTVLASHEEMIARGAAGFAALARAADLNETAANMAVSTPNYAALATIYLRGDVQFQQLGFYPWLDSIRGGQGQNRGEPYAAGWALDKYEAMEWR
jgi:hypothetical protein